MKEIKIIVSLEKGYGEVWAISNFWKQGSTVSKIFWRLVAGMSFEDYNRKIAEIKECLTMEKVKVIRPVYKLPLGYQFDTDKKRLIETVEVGKKAAETFLRENRY